MNYEMERELLLHPEMSLSRRIAYGSNELQCAQIDSFIKERVDLLIVSPNEAKQVQPAVTRAYRAGIPVIVADRRVPGDEWTAFIGGDNYKVGRLMAHWVMEKWKKRGTVSKPFVVLEVAGLPGSTPATLRHKGMMEGIEEAKEEGLAAKVEMQSVMGSWYKENAYEVVSEYLETHPLPGDMLIDAAAHILHKEPYVHDTVLETTLVDITAAYPMLKQDEAITRDLETLHIVQTQSESKWKQLRFDRFILILFVVLFFILFLITLSYIIVKQRKIQTKIKHDIIPQLENMQEAIQLSKKDEAFAERLRQVVDDYLTDPALNVEFLGGKLQLSRTQLFRRVKAVAGKGPLDYIRERRLIRADELLRTTDMTIQQVALELCFSSPGYFTKCYKEYFGHLPSVR